MHIAVVVPAHNEGQYLPGFLNSVYKQTRLPDQMVIVNDNSSDETPNIIENARKKHAFIQAVTTQSSPAHLPGQKVILAFEAGRCALEEKWDIIVKLDADLLLPPDYFEQIEKTFSSPKIGIAGGVVCEQKENGRWEINHPMGKEHVRGALKAYSKECFAAISGLRIGMGWDTVDEHLTRYFGYEVCVLHPLQVKHCRSLGNAYTYNAAQAQGEAFYRMRYGWFLVFLAALKYGFKNGSLAAFIHALLGALKAKFKRRSFYVNASQGKYIRQWRWKQLIG